MSRLLALVIASTLLSCSDQPASDTSCTFSKLQADARVADGYGILQVDGSAPADFYAFDESGQQVAYQRLNQGVSLQAGEYRVKVNNTERKVKVWSGYMAHCSTGTLIVSGHIPDDYYVTDSTGVNLTSTKLGRSVSLFPGGYTIRVNNTESPVTIRSKQITEVRTGSLTVRGTTGEHFYVLDKADKQLGFASLEEALSFLPGTYNVKVNNTSKQAKIVAGQTTSLITGNVVISALTDEYYYVTDTSGSALNFQNMNKHLALFPGVYRLRVNNSVTTAKVEAGDTTEFNTGTIVLTGAGNEYYYVLTQDGTELNFNSLNKSLSFFPSNYTIRLGSSLRRVTVLPGQLTSLEAFN